MCRLSVVLSFCTLWHKNQFSSLKLCSKFTQFPLPFWCLLSCKGCTCGILNLNKRHTSVLAFFLFFVLFLIRILYIFIILLLQLNFQTFSFNYVLLRYFCKIVLIRYFFSLNRSYDKCFLLFKNIFLYTRVLWNSKKFQRSVKFRNSKKYFEVLTYFLLTDIHTIMLQNYLSRFLLVYISFSFDACFVCSYVFDYYFVVKYCVSSFYNGLVWFI